MTWINNNADDYSDLCAHGDVTAVIGSEEFTCNCTISSTALYLLKSLTQNHIMNESNQMLPCCGHSLYPNEDKYTVGIIGCPNGIDWSIIHENDTILLITETSNKTSVPFDEYKNEVIDFVNNVETFYSVCSPKIIPRDPFEKLGYLTFWNEWNFRKEKYINNNKIMRRTIIFNADNFDDIETFYNEVDNTLTRNLNWKTDHNLDAFNDLLRGGFGIHEYGEPILIEWHNFSKSKIDFGYPATITHYKKILRYCHPTNISYIKEKLTLANKKQGLTLLDIIITIIMDNYDSGHDCLLKTIEY
jgi:RNAse (barnase) inhibitor barstar